jgi:sugar lactone lactonase YvrE
VTLTATKPSSSGTVTWSLEPGSPGTLDRSSGDSVQYIPPAADTRISDTSITVNASLGNETRKTTIVLEGAQGLSLLAGNDGGAGNRDGAGTAARFYNPADTAIDAQGTLYIADTWNRTIRKMTADGIVTTLAGSPYDPFSGSVDGTGTSARFSGPQGITVDEAGNIYVTDAKAIRKITPAGNVTTLAGRADTAGNTDGIREQARFTSPYRIAVDTAGNLFVTDLGSIRRITPSGAVTTLASTDRRAPPELQMLNAVRGIAVDRSGNVYVVDAYDQNSARDISYASSSIRRITPNGVVSTLAGVHGTLPRTAGATGSSDGNGTEARFNSPDGIAIDAAGNLFVSDTGNRTIRRVTPEGAVTTIAGSPGLTGSADGNGAAARFLSPLGITAAPDGSVYLADSFSNTIRQVTANGDVITVAGKPASYGHRDGSRSSALFWNPAGIAGDGSGNLFIADRSNHAIRRISAAGEVTTIAGMAGQPGAVNGNGADARFHSPSDIAVDSAGNLYVADTGNSLIRRITPAGAVSTLQTQYRAGAIAVDAQGNVYAGNFDSPIVRRITPSGTVTELSMLTASETHVSIGDIVPDAEGNLFATTINGIRKITPAGAVSLVGPQAPPSASPIIAPLPSITMDEEGNLYTNLPDGSLRMTTQTGQTAQVFDLEPLGFVKGFLGERKHFEMVGPKSIAITVPNGVYLLRLP